MNHIAATAAVCAVLMMAPIFAQDCSSLDNTQFLADGSKCHYYIVCTQGIGTLLVCPSGYHFNAEKQMCDYPSKAGCIKCPLVGFANVAVDGSCRKFVQCFQGTGVDRECPTGLFFDPALGQCNLQKRVKCN